MELPPKRAKAVMRELLSPIGPADRVSLWRELLHISGALSLYPATYKELCARPLNLSPESIACIRNDAGRSNNAAGPAIAPVVEYLVSVYCSTFGREYRSSSTLVAAALLTVLSPEDAFWGFVVLFHDAQHFSMQLGLSNGILWLQQYLHPIYVRERSAACFDIAFSAFCTFPAVWGWERIACPTVLRLWDYCLLHGNTGVAALIMAMDKRAVPGSGPITGINFAAMLDYPRNLRPADVPALLADAEVFRERHRKLFRS